MVATVKFTRIVITTKLRNLKCQQIPPDAHNNRGRAAPVDSIQRRPNLIAPLLLDVRHYEYEKEYVLLHQAVYSNTYGGRGACAIYV